MSGVAARRTAPDDDADPAQLIGGPRLEAVLQQVRLAGKERRFLEVLARNFGMWVPTLPLAEFVYADDPGGAPRDSDGVAAMLAGKCRDKLFREGLSIEARPGAGRRLLWRRSHAGQSAQLLPLKPPAASRPAEPLREGDVALGEAIDGSGPVGIGLGRLLEGRLLIQGSSGAGKSWTLRRLLEQTAGLVQQIVVDPEGEFPPLAERFGHLPLAGHRLDPAALATAARRAREHRVSVVLDLSELDREGQMKAVAAFFGALLDAPREHWHPALVVIDEAHPFAPFGGQAGETSSVRKAAIGALVDLMSRGRKRGLAGVLATQRLARLSKSVVSEAQNFLIGLNTLDLDIRRAAETIGWDARRAFDRLPSLSPGDFVGVGPAFSRSPAVVRVGAVVTEHRGATPAIPVPVSIDAGEAARLLDVDALIEQSQADEGIRAEAPLMPGLKAVRGFIRDPAFALAGRAWGALAPLFPEGAGLAELAAYVGAPLDEVAAALALLDGFGAVEFSGEGETRAVRIAKDMRA